MVEAKLQYRFAVLVVDDNEDILGLFKIFLESNGIEVFIATNSERALHLTASHPRIKILITDINLPNSCVNGKTLAMILMEREPRTVAIAMTGYSDKFTLDDCLRVGFKDYFVKPVKMDKLLGIVRCACSQIRRWEDIK